MNKDTAIAWVRSVVSQHVGKNIRRYTVATYTGAVQHNSLGGKSYLLPKEGKVVDQNECFTLVKTGVTEFVVVVTSLLNTPVTIGEKVKLDFYQLRRFDGTMADGSEDPAVGVSRTIMLTGAQTIFPVKWEGRYLGINEKFEASYRHIQNPYLQDLIRQMEGIPVNDDWRRAVNILVDSHCTELDFNDPLEEDSATSPPSIRCRVQTAKVTGALEIAYDRAADTYLIHLQPDGGETQTFEDIHFDELGPKLIDLIDDLEWSKVKVTKVSTSSRKTAKA